MKKLAFVTEEETHRLLYGRGLGGKFEVTFAKSAADIPGGADALVYAIPKSPSEQEFSRIEKAGIPVVVLTPDTRRRLPEAAKRCVVSYPVRVGQILNALAGLGVEGGDC